MAVKKKPAPASGELRIELSHPSLTPVLRAGLGGLASSLLALQRDGVTLPGTWAVEPRAVTLAWKDGQLFFDALFAASFRLEDGLIDLPGARSGPVRPELRAELQDALRGTFLQHGKTANKDGGPVAVTWEVDDEPYTSQIQRYTWFRHQDGAADIAPIAGTDGGVDLAGWANPGAVQRHVAIGATKMEYSAIDGLCALFALVGCVSLKAPSGGLLLVPEPTDLKAFAQARSLLTPNSVRDVTVGGAGDAALRAEAAVRMRDARLGGVGRVSVMVLRNTAWSSKQKSRVDSLALSQVDSATLDLYETLRDVLPPRLIRVEAKKTTPADTFTVVSSLRAFAADNLALGRPWHHGFAKARDLRERERFLHFRRESDNLGALRHEEREALICMIPHLEEPERLLVQSIHTALRQRYGMIADENRENTAARNNRMKGEREKWRMAFAGAKTIEQFRFALTDLWSRAHTVAELRDGWDPVMALVQRDWQAARDLSLVGLASYASKKTTSDADDDADLSPTSEI